MKIVPVATGRYSLLLINRSDRDVQVLVEGTYATLPTTGQEILGMAGPAIAGILMVMVGVPIMVIGGMVFVIDWRKERRRNTAASA